MRYSTLGKVIVSVAMLAWISHRIEFAELRNSLSHLPLASLVYASALLLLQIPLLAYRWSRILALLGVPQSWGTLWRATYLGVFFNQALPGSVGGDLVRVLVLRKRAVTLTKAFNSVLLERLSGLYAMIVLLAAIAPVVDQGAGQKSLAPLTIALLFIMSLGFILIARTDQFLPKWKWLSTVRNVITNFRQDYLTLLKNPLATTSVLLQGAASWALNLWAIQVLGASIGIDIPVTAFFLFGGLAILASVLPISLAGWGVREGSMVALFGLMHVDPVKAMTVSVTLGALMLLTSLPAGLLWLGSRHLRNGPELPPSSN